MAKRITASELFEKEDIFEGIRKSAERTMVTLEKVDAEFKKIGTTLKNDISKAKIGGAKELKEFMALVEKANNLQTNTIRLEKEKAIAEQQSEKLKQQKIRTQTAENRQQERINKQKQKALKLAKDEASAYKKLVVATRELKTQSKDLGAEMLTLEQAGKKNTKEYRKLSEQYKRVTKSAQQGDAQLKKLDKTVGDNFRNVGNYVGALNTLKTGLAQLGLAFGIGQVVRGGVEAIVDFDQAVADLSAITGASGRDLEFYKKQAHELGVGVEGGASAVVEAYKLIGSAKPELLDNAQALNELTKSAITLSQASGMELPEASKHLTDAMNQFGASSEQAGKFIDVLASGSKFGSAEIPQITEALLKFGAVAKGTNVSIQESVGAIELLAEKGIKGAEAGTKLRNVMLKLSAPEALPKKARDVIKSLGISFEEMIDPSKSFEDRLKLMQPLLEDNSKLVKVFGMENEVAGQILLENTDRLGELTEKMDTNGVAQEQANKRTNTLGHSLMELKNQFFQLFTQIGSGEGSMQWFIDGIQWLAQNLPMIATIIFKVVRAWVVYKGVMLSLKVINFAMTGGLKDIGSQMMKQIPLTKAYAKEQKNLAKAKKGTIKATSGLASGLATMGIGLAIGLVTELAVKMYDLASGEAEARRQADLLAQATKRGNKIAEEKTGKFAKELDEQLRTLDHSTRIAIAEEKNEKKRAEIRENALKQMDDFTQATKKNIQTEIDAVVKRNKQRQKTRDIMVAEAKASESFIGKAFGSTHVKDVRSQFNKEIKAQNIVTRALVKQRDELSKQSEEFKVRLIEETESNKDYTVSIKDNSNALGKGKKTLEDYNTTFKETNVYLSKAIELTQELTEIEQKRELLKREKGIEKEFQAQLKLLEETGEFDATRLNDLIQNKITLEQEYIDQRTIYELDQLEQKYKLIEQKEFDALEKQRKTLIAGAKGNAEAIEQINKNFDLKKKELEAKETMRQNDRAKEEVIIVENAENEKLEIREEGLESIDEHNAEFLDKEKELTDQLKDQERQRAQNTQAFVRATADYFIKRSQEKIKQIEKEISEAEKQADTLRALAENGNIEAKESLAEQQKIIADANRKKEAEQKRQQRIQLASSVYATYSSKVASNSKNPLAETIRDTTLLQQFIQSLPTFSEGIEDTGTSGRGIDGKGGFLSVLHPNERVVPKSLNDQIGNMTNDELSRIAMEYQNGKIVRSDSQSSSALELAVLVNRLDNLTKVIQDKPETNIELGEITQGAMEIVKSTKTGNTLVYNRYKIK